MALFDVQCHFKYEQQKLLQIELIHKIFQVKLDFNKC